MSNDIVDLPVYNSQSLTDSQVSNLIMRKKSFKVENIESIGTIVRSIEKEIERQGLKCRVYTEYRSTAIAATGSAWLTPAAFLLPVTLAASAVGLATGVGIAAHNLATYNPDYEIAKNQIKDYIVVKYKK